MIPFADTTFVEATWILVVAFSGPLALYLLLNTFLSQFLIAEFHLDRTAASHRMVWLNAWALPTSLLSGVLLAKQLEESSVPVQKYIAAGMLHGHLNRSPSLKPVDLTLDFFASVLAG